MNNQIRDLRDQLIHEFITRCNYVATKGLQKQLEKFAENAGQICIDLQIDPGTYVDAQLTYAPIIRGYSSLTPQQLCSKDSRIYAQDYVSQRGTRDPEREFETQCRIFGQALEAGWTEELCLRNPTLDFYPYFRILIRSVRDEELIKTYGNLANQTLSNDKVLVDYLKTVKSDTGVGLDFSRIPNFKNE